MVFTLCLWEKKKGGVGGWGGGAGGGGGGGLLAQLSQRQLDRLSPFPFQLKNGKSLETKGETWEQESS